MRTLDLERDVYVTERTGMKNYVIPSNPIILNRERIKMEECRTEKSLSPFFQSI